MSPPSPAFSRPNWAEINLAALRHNARVLARHAAPAKLCAVTKADAYGHGATQIAAALEPLPEIALFGVASVEEGLELRASGLEKPILLLSAVLPEQSREIVRANLMATVFSREVAEALQRAAEIEKTVAHAHFKVDTGMARLGVSWCEAATLWRELQTLNRVKFSGFYTHLACADEPNDEFSSLQLKRFEEVYRQIRPAPEIVKHAANSAATLRYPNAHLGLVRPGIALYGVNPLRESGIPNDLDLRPVMTWKARVTHLKTLAAGETVSYGATWKASRASRIAVVPCGYADGYLRALSNRGQVLIDGEKCSVVGRVTMDQILVDVTELSTQPQLGAPVTVFGENLPVEHIAALAGTISYELLCAVSSRVPRIYQE